jgi:hypothetical protein
MLPFDDGDPNSLKNGGVGSEGFAGFVSFNTTQRKYSFNTTVMT